VFVDALVEPDALEAGLLVGQAVRAAFADGSAAEVRDAFRGAWPSVGPDELRVLPDELQVALDVSRVEGQAARSVPDEPAALVALVCFRRAAFRAWRCRLEAQAWLHSLAEPDARYQLEAQA